MKRSNNSTFTEHINVTYNLMKKYPTTSEVVSAITKRFGISIPQAYRYIREAKKANQILPIPERKAVFTVKIRLSLIKKIREFANSTGESISHIVEHALEAYLRKGRGNGQKEKPKENTEPL